MDNATSYLFISPSREATPFSTIPNLVSQYLAAQNRLGVLHQEDEQTRKLIMILSGQIKEAVGPNHSVVWGSTVVSVVWLEKGYQEIVVTRLKGDLDAPVQFSVQ